MSNRRLRLFACACCRAVWHLLEDELGLEIRSTVVSRDQVRVELRFKAEGELKNFSAVELRFGKRAVTASRREDRSKPGHFVVSATIDRSLLGDLSLWVKVPGTDGGAIYDLRVKDFVEPKGNR